MGTPEAACAATTSRRRWSSFRAKRPEEKRARTCGWSVHTAVPTRGTATHTRTHAQTDVHYCTRRTSSWKPFALSSRAYFACKRPSCGAAFASSSARFSVLYRDAVDNILE